MTLSAVPRATGPDDTLVGAGGTALSRLVADPDRFAREDFGRRAVLTPAGDLPGGFSDLFGEAAVDELIAGRGLRTPFLRVAKDGSTLPASAFTSGGGVGAGIADQLDDTRLTQLFASGATLVLQALHRTWAPVGSFAGDLAAELGHPVQVNAYVTPPQSRGFDDHYDVHDVFVLQISGEKRWRIHEPVHPSPLRDQPWTDRRDDVAAAARTEPTIDEVLRPGDCLYLPRGYLHAATALGDVSTHLTFGVHTWTRHQLARELLEVALADLAADEQVRASLPFGVDVADEADLGADLALVRERLHAAIDAVDDATIAARMSPRVDASARASGVGPLAQLRAAQDVGGASSRLELREHLRARIEGSRLVTRAGAVDLDEHSVEPVRVLLETGVLSIPAADERFADLARELLAAGVVRSV